MDQALVHRTQTSFINPIPKKSVFPIGTPCTEDLQRYPNPWKHAAIDVSILTMVGYGVALYVVQKSK